MSPRQKWLISVASLILAALCWEAVSRSGVVPRKLFPAPTDVAEALATWALHGSMVNDLSASLGRALLGYALGALLGVSVGIATGRHTVVDALISPIVNALRPIPPVAIIPLVILWAGIGDGAKVAATTFATFFPVWLATHAGAQGVPQIYLWSGQMLGSSPWRSLRAIVLPAALPTIIAGLRLGLAVAFVMVFVSELAGASSGLGYQIALSQSAYRIDLMMAALFLLAGSAAFLDYIQLALLRALFPWLDLTSK